MIPRTLSPCGAKPPGPALGLQYIYIYLTVGYDENHSDELGSFCGLRTHLVCSGLPR
jgi:hypothetical protein